MRFGALEIRGRTEKVTGRSQTIIENADKDLKGNACTNTEARELE